MPINASGTFRWDCTIGRMGAGHGSSLTAILSLVDIVYSSIFCRGYDMPGNMVELHLLSGSIDDICYKQLVRGISPDSPTESARFLIFSEQKAHHPDRVTLHVVEVDNQRLTS